MPSTLRPTPPTAPGTTTSRSTWRRVRRSSTRTTTTSWSAGTSTRPTVRPRTVAEVSDGPGAVRRCGVLGDPIAHSLSPALHRAAYAELRLDWTYDAHRVASGDLGAFLSGLDPAWRGLSLTMPLKREALPLVDRLTDRARLAGAVNTLVLEDDGTRVGDNTDLPGAVAAIRERTAIPLATATILGGGATATSVGLALADLGVNAIVLAVRDEARATETLAALRAHPAAPEVVVSTLGTGAAGSDVVVSTIPAAAQTPELVARCADVPVV